MPISTAPISHTGRPCRVCGATERYISTGKCIACCRKNSRASAKRRYLSRIRWRGDKNRDSTAYLMKDARDMRFEHVTPEPWHIEGVTLAQLMAGK